MKGIAVILSILVSVGAFGQGEEGEGESAPSPVCFNLNALNADAAADDVCFSPIEGYERIVLSADSLHNTHRREWLPPSNNATEREVLWGSTRSILRSTFGVAVYYAPQDPNGRAMMVAIDRRYDLPLHSRTKPRGRVSETVVRAELLAEAHNGGGEAPRTMPYDRLRRTDTGTLVVEDCDYLHFWWGGDGLVLGEGDDLRNVDRMVRRYLEGQANPAVCTWQWECPPTGCTD